MRQLWEAREGPPGAVYSNPLRRTTRAEVAMKSYDFARSSIDRRWAKRPDAMTRGAALPARAPALRHAASRFTPQSRAGSGPA